jgi:DNA-binding NarL/FixJ family response regulator
MHSTTPEQRMSSIRLLVADSEELARLGVRAFLDNTEVEIVAETTDCRRTTEAVDAVRPDVVILAVRMSDGNGFSVLKHIRAGHGDLPVIVTDNQDHPAHFARAHQSGASAYLLKTFDPNTLLATVRCVAGRQQFWTRNHMRRITGVLSTPRLDGDLDAPLTPRELEVLQSLTAGNTNQGIARDLGISYETVKEHVQHVLAKIGVSDRTQAAVWAVRNSLA